MTKWRWQSFGGHMMLVTDGGGAQVVLCAGVARSDNAPALHTRGDKGYLVQVTGDEEPLRLIAAAPDLAHELEQMVRHCLSCDGSGKAGIRRDVKCPICLGGRIALAKARGESTVPPVPGEGR